jgi:hypothetical protein
MLLGTFKHRSSTAIVSINKLEMKLYQFQKLVKLAIRCTIIYTLYYTATLILNPKEETIQRSFTAPKTLAPARRISTLGKYKVFMVRM